MSTVRIMIALRFRDSVNELSGEVSPECAGCEYAAGVVANAASEVVQRSLTQELARDRVVAALAGCTGLRPDPEWSDASICPVSSTIGGGVEVAPNPPAVGA